AMLVMPDRPWRILHSPHPQHSTVWDGGDLIFDFNCQAFGVDPYECFDKAFEKVLAPGKNLRVYCPERFTVEQRRRMADQAKQMQDQLVVPEPEEEIIDLGNCGSELETELRMTAHLS